MVAFYRCPGCHSNYARRKDGALTDRWGMPISLALYPLIFEQDYESSVRPVLLGILGLGKAYADAFLDDIRLELAAPRQELSRMHKFRFLGEADLRGFLKTLEVALTLGVFPSE